MATLEIFTPALPLGQAWPELKGTAAENTEVRIFSGSQYLGSVVADGIGDWTFQVPSSLRDGKVLFTAKEFVNNRFGATSESVEYTRDSIKPTAPTVDAIKLPTKDTTPTLTGKAEAFSTVKVYHGGTEELGTAIANSRGVWTLDANTLPADGAYEITAKATDLAGNTSPATSRPMILTIDTKVDSLSIAEMTSAASKVTTQRLSGTAEAGAKIMVYNGPPATTGTPMLAREVVADRNGNWTATTIKLLDGTYELYVKATDVAGNVGVTTTLSTQILSIDTTAPDVPTVNDLGWSPSKTLPIAFLGGTAAVGTRKIEVFAGSIKIGEAVISDTDTTWTLTEWLPAASNIKDGVQKITAKATDAAGNISRPSTPVNLTIDNKDPTAPTVNAIKLPSNLNEPQILSGKTEKGATVEVFANLESLGLADVDDKGVWTLDIFNTNPKLADDGNYNITAKAKDAAGNVSGHTVKHALLVVDTTAPTATLNLTKKIDKVATQKLVGTAEAGAKIQIYSDQNTDPTRGLLAKEVVADKNGNWSASVRLADKVHALTITATDAAGNTSLPIEATFLGSDQTLTIDTEAPNLPVIDPIGSLIGRKLPSLSGMADEGATVNVYAGSVLLGTIGPVLADGLWALNTSGINLRDGVQSITAKAVDAAGNITKASAAQKFTIKGNLDIDVPTLVSAVANAGTKTIVLTYDEALNAKTALKTDFEVSVNGNPDTNPAGVKVVGKTVVLTMGTNIETGKAVTVKYTPPPIDAGKTNAAIQDVTGNDAALIGTTTKVPVALLLKYLTNTPITNYDTDTDTIQLSKATFRALGTSTSLDADFLSVANAAALDGGSVADATNAAHIIYLQTGELYYNANGPTKGGLTLIGTFAANTALTAAEFEIV